MNLQTLNLLKLLPMLMRDDRTAQGLSYAIEKQLKKIILEIENVKIYSRIETLPSAVLDELAWQFNMPEYSASYSLDVKRDLIKNCVQTHRLRGTVAGVESVINSVFGIGWVEEWFEYDGDPYHFRVHTTNPSVTDEMLVDFERVLKSTQNVRSVLDSVIVELVTEMDLNYGGYISVSEYVYLEM